MQVGINTILTITFALTVYIGLNIYVTIRIKKADYLKEERRRLHKKLIWIIPFLGPLLIKSFWANKKKTSKTKTKKDRKINKSSFYESKKGIFG